MLMVSLRMLRSTAGCSLALPTPAFLQADSDGFGE
jgi:hypothetical protein